MDIHELHAQGLRIRRITQVTGYSRNTVSKALAQRGMWQYKPRQKVGSKLDRFKPYLLECLGFGVTNAIRLLAEIQAQGYTGGYTLAREFARSHRPPAPPGLRL